MEKQDPEDSPVFVYCGRKENVLKEIGTSHDDILTNKCCRCSCEVAVSHATAERVRKECPGRKIHYVCSECFKKDDNGDLGLMNKNASVMPPEPGEVVRLAKRLYRNFNSRSRQNESEDELQRLCKGFIKDHGNTA